MDNAMPIRADLFKHQQSACETAMGVFDAGISRGYALLMEMGCGKSLTAIAIAGRLYLEGRIARILVVAPLSIVGVWEDEFRKFAAFDYTLAVLNGSSSKKADTLRHLGGKSLQVAVVNYESAWRLENEIAVWLVRDGGSLIVADEGHKIKTHSANASKAISRTVSRSHWA